MFQACGPFNKQTEGACPPTMQFLQCDNCYMHKEKQYLITQRALQSIEV